MGVLNRNLNNPQARKPVAEESIAGEQNSRAVSGEGENQGREHNDQSQGKDPRKQIKIRDSLTQMLFPFSECIECQTKTTS